MDATHPRHVYETYIRCTPEALWQALTDPSFTSRYYYGASVQSTWAAGAPYQYANGDFAMITGEVLEADPPRRLVTTFKAHWDPALADDAPSRLSYEITPLGEACKLTMVHDQFATETATFHAVGGGWPMIAAGLKTLLETGQPLVVAEG